MFRLIKWAVILYLLWLIFGCVALIEVVRNSGYETSGGYWITIDDGIQVTYPRPNVPITRGPPACEHLYDNGNQQAWQTCMRVCAR